MNENFSRSKISAIELSPISNVETSSKAKTKTISMTQEDYDFIYGDFGVKSVIENVTNFLLNSKIKLNDSELLISQFKARLRDKDTIMLLGDIELSGENIVEMQRTISEDWKKITSKHLTKIITCKKQYALELVASVLINMLGYFRDTFYYWQEADGDYFDFKEYKIFDGEDDGFIETYCTDMKNFFSWALVDVFFKNIHPEISDMNHNFFQNMFLAKNKKIIDELFDKFIEKFEEIFIISNICIPIEKQANDCFVLEVHGTDVLKPEFVAIDSENEYIKISETKSFIEKYEIEKLIDEPEKIFKFLHNLNT